jgi:hypothetical protein
VEYTGNLKYITGVTEYVVDGNDGVLNVDTSVNAVLIILPNILGSGYGNTKKGFIINDVSGNASVNNITIIATNNSINSSSSVKISVDGGTAKVSVANNDEWFAVTEPQTSGGGTGTLTVTSVTYAELVDLINNSTLIEGSYYLINDFQTVFDQPDYSAPLTAASTVQTLVGALEPLIVQAVTTYSINSRAISTVSPTDILEYDVNFSETEINAEKAYGRISLRIDDQNNKAYYDHRAVTYKRYNDGDGNYVIYYDNGNDFVDRITTFSKGSFNMTINSNSGNKPFLLPNSCFGEQSSNTITGDSFCNNTFGANCSYNVFGDNCTYNLAYKNFTSNKIGNWFTQNIITNNFGYSELTKELDGNIIGDWFAYNRFIGINCNFSGNKIGNYFGVGTDGGSGANLIDGDDGFRNNVIGDYFNGNQISNKTGGVGFSSNQIGNYFNSNTITESFVWNSIKHFFNNNQLTNIYFQSNEIQDNFSGNNIIKGRFKFNTIAESFQNNYISNYIFEKNNINYGFSGNNFVAGLEVGKFDNNIIGSGFGNNFGNSAFSSNRIANSFASNGLIGSPLGSFTENVIGNNFNNNPIIGSTFSNNTIAENFQNNVSIGSNFQNNLIKTDFQTSTIGILFTNNIISGSFRDNLIQDSFNANFILDVFTGNRIKTGCKNNTISAQFNNNTIDLNFQNNNVICQVVSTDFSTATRVYATYNTTILYASSLANVLVYHNGTIYVTTTPTS